MYVLKASPFPELFGDTLNIASIFSRVSVIPRKFKPILWIWSYLEGLSSLARNTYRPESGVMFNAADSNTHPLIFFIHRLENMNKALLIIIVAVLALVSYFILKPSDANTDNDEKDDSSLTASSVAAALSD